jgi:hypothetical protein
LAAVSRDLGGYDTVHDDDSVGSEYGENFLHDFLQVAAVAADEDGIRSRRGTAAYTTEVADVEVDAGGTVAAGVLLNDSFALRADFEGFDVEMGEQEAGFDADTTCAGADVPEHTAMR